MDYEKILEIIKKLKDSAKRKLIKDIFLLLVSKEKQNNCAELVCPHCNSKYIVKNGKNKDKQRYKCKSCRKSFIPETNTPIYYSKKDIAVWIQYLECLFAQNSLKDCAEKCKISVSTAFFWRHRILDAIREITNKQVLKINSLHSKIKSFFVAYKGVSTKYLSNYIALFHYIFDKIKASPLSIKGEQPFRNSNFKGRSPIFD